MIIFIGIVLFIGASFLIGMSFGLGKSALDESDFTMFCFSCLIALVTFVSALVIYALSIMMIFNIDI